MTKSNLYIIGAGGLGREMESWLERTPRCERDWELAGYLDSGYAPGRLRYPSDLSIIGNPVDFSYKADDYVIIAIADSGAREQLYFSLKERVSFFTYIDQTAIIGKFSSIGEGSIVCPNSIVSTNVKLGLCSILNAGSHIGHDSSLGNFCSIMPNCDIGGGCTLGHRVFMGTNSSICPGKAIGDGTKVSAGCVITRTYKQSGLTIYGNPSKRLR
eukprot:COSAG01_NODE_183_length_22835_cov_17.169247_8_plen_214_part_00